MIPCIPVWDCPFFLIYLRRCKSKKMKKITVLLLSAMYLLACSSDKENTMYVTGSIKGLKKGTLYLQKQVDSLIVSVDSISVNGTEEFLLQDELESPEMYFLTLGRGSGDKKIAFFGERDTIHITSYLEKFALRVSISGSENQRLLDEFYDMKKKFNDQNLDLIKEEFEARKTGNQDSVDAVAAKLRSWTRRKYLYTTNFAVNNANREVSPYIALTELQDANLGLLDTINNSLSEEVRAGKYGRQLDTYIRDIRESAGE